MKATTGNSFPFSIKSIKRYGAFSGDLFFGSIIWSRDEKQLVTVVYNVDNMKGVLTLTSYVDHQSGTSHYLNYRLSLLKTPCYYGGYRYWFQCNFCYRKVGVLYFGRSMKCRKCANLCYLSQRAGRLERSIGSKGYIYMLDEEYRSMRTTHYAGKPTKRYLRYLKRSNKAESAFCWAMARLK